MKKYIINSITLMLIVAFAVTCQKSNETKILPGPEMISSIINGEQFYVPDNYIILRHMSISSPMQDDNGREVTFYGNFKQNGQPVSFGNIGINERTVQPVANGAYWFDFKTENVLQEGLNMLDTHVEITIPESQYSSGITDTISMPGALHFSTANNYNRVLNKNQDYEINWNKNVYTNTQMLVIQAYYLSGLSQHYNSGFPNTIESIKYNVPNTGRFTIPAADFDRFPAGTYVEVLIGTGSYKVQRPTRGPDIYFLTVSDERSTPLLVVE